MTDGMAWGAFTNKFSSQRLGDVVLLAERERHGVLRGRIVDVEGRAIGRGRVYVRSVASPGLWVTAWADAAGAFTTRLPAGRYQVAAAVRGSEAARMLGTNRTRNYRALHQEDDIVPSPADSAGK